jgi:hypothetical protein
MKNNILLFIASLFITVTSIAQSSGRIGSHDGVGKWMPSTTIASGFTNIDDGRQITQEIIDIVGLKANFDIREANIPNAAAVVYGGKRYVLYNPNFIRQLVRTTGTKWAAISVLAHEIGHHLQGHTITSSGSSPAVELEADEFSGFVLRKMGATLAEAQSAMKTIATQRASRTHPGQSDRLTSIAAGWKHADDQLAGRKTDVAKRTEPIREAQPTVTYPQRQQTETVLADRYVLGHITFTSDPTSRYYVTTQYNVVKVANNQLQVIGKLSKTNNSRIPYIIHDNETQLFVRSNGSILTENGREVGSLRNA